MAIIENKWGIKNIFKYYLPQQKMLRKIWKSVFITKKFTQCKISSTLKIDAFETPDNKTIGKLFSKHQLFFLNQANSISVSSINTIISHTESLPASLTISVKFYPSHLKPLFNNFFIVFFIGFCIF